MKISNYKIAILLPVYACLLLLFVQGKSMASLCYGLPMDLQAMTDSAPNIVYGTVVSTRYVGKCMFTTDRDASGMHPGSVDMANVQPSALNKGIVITYHNTFNGVDVYSAKIKRLATLKGGYGGDTIEVQYYDEFTGLFEMLHVGDHGIFFLDSESRPFNLYHPFLPTANGIDPLPADGTPIEMIGKYMVKSLRADASDKVLEACTGECIQLRLKKQAVEALYKLSTDGNVRISSYGLWGLLAFKDKRAFPNVVDFLLDPPDNVNLHAQYMGILSALGSLGTPSLASGVVPLLSASSVGVRREAIYALRIMGNPDSIPALANELWDEDSDIQYCAIMALADITGKHEWGPTVDIFKKDPEGYLNKWRTWWKQGGKWDRNNAPKVRVDVDGNRIYDGGRW
jgi:hypothetical protein